MKRYFIPLFFILSCSWAAGQKREQKLLIETEYGNITVKLYNETPQHRDNFLKLVKKHFYDSLLFHRVINTFMIQGGDPDSKNAPLQKALGDGDVGYTLPAEFSPALFHKRGVVAAARNGDEVNPEQESSGGQFYIVQGKTFTDSLLDVLEKRITRMRAYNNILRKKENKEWLENYLKAQQEGQWEKTQSAKAKLEQLTDAELPNVTPYKFSADQRNVYKTTGGTPHLDGSYTVFGEVTDGMEVVDKIASAPRNQADRPLTDVRMKISIMK